MALAEQLLDVNLLSLFCTGFVTWLLQLQASNIVVDHAVVLGALVLSFVLLA